LEGRGFRFLEPASREILRKAGAEAIDDAGTMRLDRGLVMEKLALAPREFPLRARNRERDLHIGGRSLVFASVGGPAFCNDLDKGRRPGTHAEVCDFLKLVQSLNIIHQEAGGPFEAMDLPPETRHLDLYLAQMTLLDKNCQAYALGGTRTRDCIDMNCIAMGVTREELAKDPAVMAIVNTNSPMQLDIPMTEAVVELATREVRQVTEGRGSCEYPSWAPNGRHLVFACNRGRGEWQLTVSDRLGREVQVLATGRGSNAQPDWSP